VLAVHATGFCKELWGPVADLLRLVTYAEGYGQFAMARGRYLELPEDVQRANCGECASCSVHCPNGVEVQRRVAQAQALFSA